MGFRFRRSINLGGGFRINISKSGIGYSWGGKGFRYTHSATGKKRVTASFGHGISYSTSLGSSKKRRKSKGYSSEKPASYPSAALPKNNVYSTEQIVNNVSAETVSEGLEHLVNAIRKSLIWDKAANVLIVGDIVYILIYLFVILSNAKSFVGTLIMILLTLISVSLKIIVRIFGKVSLEYNIDEDMKEQIQNNIAPYKKITKCRKIWRENESSKVINTKYTAGASHLVKRTECKVSKRFFPIKTSEDMTVFTCNNKGNESIILLPDKVLVVFGIKIGALDYSDINIRKGTTHYIEKSGVPRDSQIVQYTWKFVNKSGGPDKRFSNNPRYPVCLYGEMTLQSDKGLNTVLIFSNPNV